MNNFGHYGLFFFVLYSSLLISQFGSATVLITDSGTVESRSNNETASVSSCYCNCAPVITVSCPTAPPLCPTTTDRPTHPPVSDSTTSTTGSFMSSTINPSTSLPVTNPLTTKNSSTSTVTIITVPSTTTSSGSTMSVTSPSTNTSTSSTTSGTASTTTSSTTSPISVTSPTSTSSRSTTTATYLSSTITATVPSSTTIGSSSTSSIKATSTPVSSSSTILTTPSTSRPSTATFTSTRQSSISSAGTSSTTPLSTNCSSVLFSDSGWFTSPNYPNVYNNNLDCKWLINVTGKIVLTFQFFNTESNFDLVSVYDGPTTASYRLLYASGSTIPPPTNSSGGQMLITFRTDSSSVYKGFNATYLVKKPSSSSPTTSPPLTSSTKSGGSTISILSTNPNFTRPTTSGPILDNCQAILAGDSGTFSSPYYPQNYPSNANCSWIITANGRVTITFHQFKTETSHDVLKIYDGPTINNYQLLAASGPIIPSSVISSGSQVLITFFSDGSVNDKGFNASYSLYVPPTTTLPPYYYCGENITNVSSGYITSPNFPKGYPAFSRCTWTVQTAPGTRIQFHFTDFSTRSGDYVEVFGDKFCTLYPVISQSGNVSSICGFVSNANSLKITFNSGALSSTLYPGFRASFTTDHGCDAKLNNTNQGTFRSPGYGINGTFSYSCSYKLGVSQGSKLNFSVSDTMGSPPSMYFYEGYNQSQYLLASGRPISSYFAVSRSNQVSLDMSYGSTCWSACSSSCSTNAVCRTAGLNDGKWKGSYSATTGSIYGCHGSMNTETRTVTSPGYPSKYTQRDLRCYWKIEEPTGKKLQLTFPVPVSLYKDSRYNYYDTLAFANPPWNLNINGGTVNPSPITIGSNETSMSFSTYYSIDNSSLYSGWKINWNAISSP